jgi:uncharacterized membrane protein YqiK
MDLFKNLAFTMTSAGIIVVLGILAMVAKWYRKAAQGQALVKTGVGGTKVSFNGKLIIPVLHRLEIMDISLKNITISRNGNDGLVCKDNLRADIKVVFFVRVNKTSDSVIKVAQSVGCERASNQEEMVTLFDSKFSEALKTVGKQFDFVDLYNKRDEFRQEILKVIGTDLNGYVLDDAAIDYLEQTPIEQLSESNILDAEGIKKIIDITSHEKIAANLILREKEKVITKQNVEAREVILELEKQLAEKEEQQKREIANIKSREEAEIAKVAEEERLKSENTRIAVSEELAIAEENKLREVIVAAKNKERTAAVETERVEKDRMLELTERERVVTLAQIEKEKAVEEEKKNIQEVIRERVAIEKTVVVEEESIKDTKATALADRDKIVAITKAEEEAEAALVQEIKKAEATKQAAEHYAKQKLIDAQASQEASMQEAQAIKTLADAKAAQEAAIGISEAQVMEAKAAAHEKEGAANAAVIEAEALAEAKGIQAKSHAQAIANLEIGEAAAKIAKEKGFAESEIIAAVAKSEKEKGLAEAAVTSEKYHVEAVGIDEKAAAMKKFDEVGKEHEEFKLKLEKDKEVELAGINIQKDIAEAQASVLGTALESANIDIVGGEQVFFDKIVNAISNGKYVERALDNSSALTEVKDHLLDNMNGDNMGERIKSLINQFGVTSEDLKNLSVANLLIKMNSEASDSKTKGILAQLLETVNKAGIGNLTPESLGIKK